HVPARTPPTTQHSGLAVTALSFSALKVSLKIRGVLKTPRGGRGSLGMIIKSLLTPRIALSIRAYESQMTEKRSLNLLIGMYS
ncbi:hypothetical protein TSAR_010510, partial [Trichomalopsis sarcophagae]